MARVSFYPYNFGALFFLRAPFLRSHALTHISKMLFSFFRQEELPYSYDCYLWFHVENLFGRGSAHFNLPY